MVQADYLNTLKKLLAENKAALQAAQPDLWDRLHRAGAQETKAIRETVEIVLNDPETALARDLKSYAEQLTAMRKEIGTNQEQSAAAKDVIQLASKRIEEQYGLFRDQLNAMKHVAEQHIGTSRANELKQLFNEHKDVIRKELVLQMEPLFELKKAYEDSINAMLNEREQMKEEHEEKLAAVNREQEERKKESDYVNQYIVDSKDLLDMIRLNTDSSQEQATNIHTLTANSNWLSGEQRKLSALLLDSFELPGGVQITQGALPYIIQYIAHVDEVVGKINTTQEDLSRDVATARDVIKQVHEGMLNHLNEDVNMDSSAQKDVAQKLDTVVQQLTLLQSEFQKQIAVNTMSQIHARDIQKAYDQIILLGNTVLQASTQAQQMVSDLSNISEGTQQIQSKYATLYDEQQKLANQVEHASRAIEIKEQQLIQTSEQIQQVAAVQRKIAAEQNTALKSIMDTGSVLKKITNYVIPQFNTDIRSFSEKMKLAERSMLEKESQPRRKFVQSTAQQPKAGTQQMNFHPPVVNDTESESSDEEEQVQFLRKNMTGFGRQNTKYMCPTEYATLQDFTPTRTGIQLAVKAQLKMKTGTILFSNTEEFLVRSPVFEDELIIVHQDDQFTHACVPNFAYVPTLGMCVAGGKGKVLKLVASLPSMLFFVEEERQRNQVYTRCYGLLQLALLGFTRTVILVARANSDTLRFKPIESVHTSDGQSVYSLSTKRGPIVSDGGIRLTIRDIPYLIEIIDYVCGRSRFPAFIQRDFEVKCKQLLGSNQ